MTGPVQATANTVPADDTYSLTVVPEGVWISCTVYFAAGNIRRVAFIDALSASVEVELSPNVADAGNASASITMAVLVSNAIDTEVCLLPVGVVGGSIP